MHDGLLFSGGVAEMRAVMMTCAAAGLGLLPAAVATGIGEQILSIELPNQCAGATAPDDCCRKLSCPL